MLTQDLIFRAAHFFVLAEQSSRWEFLSKKLFWNMSASLIVETVPHLPAMAAIVRKIVARDVFDLDIFEQVTSRSFPGVFPAEAVRWHNHLVSACEVHRASKDVIWQNLARRALVRLDGCDMPDGHERPSRLPEWLAEARKIVSDKWTVVSDRPYWELEALAALAAWRPAARVITPPETLCQWVDFWLKMQQTDDLVEKGIAAIALLNLPEADLRAASIPPPSTAQLIRQVTTAIWSASGRRYQNYLSLLDWQPVKGTTWPVAEIKEAAQFWLGAAKHRGGKYRHTAWQQLIRWERAGSLAICGMDLLPELVQAVRTEKDPDVLCEMAQWVPNAQHFTATGAQERRSLLRQLERAWKRHRTSGDFYKRASAWLVGIRLHQTGLASERPGSLLKAYLSGVADERNPFVLFILGQWSPGTEAPGRWYQAWDDTWWQKLLNEYEPTRWVAAGTLLRQILEKEPDRLLRRVALKLWRGGTKASSEASRILDAVFARLQEVQACLAAGEVPDFERGITPPAERHRPPLALPPGRIADNEWKMENKELKMNNGEWRMQHQEATPNPRLVPDSPSR